MGSAITGATQHCPTEPSTLEDDPIGKARVLKRAQLTMRTKGPSSSIAVIRKCALTGSGIALVAAIVAGGAWKLMEQVRAGEGLDYYFTGTGAKMNPIGAMVTILALLVVLPIGWLLSRLYERRQSEHRRMFGKPSWISRYRDHRRRRLRSK